MATQKKKKVSRRKKQRRMLLVEFFILLLLLVGLLVWRKVGKINFTSLKDLKTNSLDPQTQELLKGYTTIAFFGVDNRSNGNYKSGNSDSIMVCVINNDTKEVKIISVYRDTFLDTGDGSLHKCNYAYNHGGIESAVQMLNNNLDLDIQEYVAVDFYALANAVDAVGGIDLPEPITGGEAGYVNSYIPEVAAVTGIPSDSVYEGQTHLNGVQAVSFCRVRYTAGGDFQRASRQREVVSALVAKAKEADLSELNDLVDTVFPQVSTSLSVTQILGMATAMKDYTLSDSRGFPFDMVTATFDKKGDVVVPCTLESNVKQLYSYLYGDDAHECSAELKHISQSIVEYTGKNESSALDYGY